MRRRAVLGLGAVPAAVGLAPDDATGDLPDASPPRRWVHTWTAMPQPAAAEDLPPPPFAGTPLLAGTTVRQTVHVTIGGSRLRIRLSNAFGAAPLAVTTASVGLPPGGRSGVAELRPGSVRPLTFGGRVSAVVPAGAQLVSDPVPLVVGEGSALTVSLYLDGGLAGSVLTGHPVSQSTTYLRHGNHCAAAGLPGATPVERWYLISGVEVESARSALAVIGDSLTDGRGSTTDGNDRWPDRLFTRFPEIAVLNQAAAGNRVLGDGPGPNVLARLDRDVLVTSGVDRVLLFEGAGDIGAAPATRVDQERVAGDLPAGYRQVVDRARALGLRVYGATLTPFGGHAGYDDEGGLRERTRQQVNASIRSGRIFDAVVDFDAAARDPLDGRRLAPGYDTGDHLHLNPAGYAALARAVPLHLLA